MKLLSSLIPENVIHKPFDADSSLNNLPICITASKHNPKGGSGTYLIRNYLNDDIWEVGEAIRATSAFPTVCPPFEKNGEQYLDGGLLANNPSLDGFNEVGRVWPTRSIGMFHSIGMNGSAQKVEPHKRRSKFIEAVSPIVEVIAES